MNDLQIEYFMAAAENLSFTKTANEKFVSQPAVSKQISAMEAELGVELFERGHNFAKLTQAGRLFYDYFKKYKNEMGLLKKQIREGNKDEMLELKIGCGSGWTQVDFFSKSLKKMPKTGNNYRICLESYAFHQIMPAISKNEIDIGITVSTDVDLLSTMEISVLTEVPQVILYSLEHPLAGKQNVTPCDFRDEVFFVPQSDRTTFIVDLVNGFCEPYGFTPKIQAVRNTESMLMNVHCGQGVAITDFWTLQMGGSLFRYVLLEATHTITAVWKKNNQNPLVPAFVTALNQVLGSERSGLEKH